MPPRLVIPCYIWNRNGPLINQRRRHLMHLMPLAEFDVVMAPPNPDISLNRAVAPIPNMALVADGVVLQRNLLRGHNVLREVILHNSGPNKTRFGWH